MPTPDITLTLLYQASLLAPYSEKLIHGFTGKSASFGGPDTPQNRRETVLSNRQTLLNQLGISSQKEWIIPQQIHGHRLGRTGDQSFSQTDGILLLHPHQPVMLLFADCVPILFYDPSHHAGAIVHAGWRGTSQKIVAEAVIALQNCIGSNPQELIAIIGPAIGQCCFQVSLEVAQTIAQSQGLSLKELQLKGILVWDQDYPENPRLDLKAMNRMQLIGSGVQQIETLPHCTRCLEAELFSYRRGEDGRNSAFMMLQ